jgi:hypothetical protein
MSAQPKPIKRLIDGLTDEEIQGLIDERIKEGATSCVVVLEGDHKYLVTQYPPASGNP